MDNTGVTIALDPCNSQRQREAVAQVKHQEQGHHILHHSHPEEHKKLENIKILNLMNRNEQQEDVRKVQDGPKPASNNTDTMVIKDKATKAISSLLNTSPTVVPTSDGNIKKPEIFVNIGNHLAVGDRGFPGEDVASFAKTSLPSHPAADGDVQPRVESGPEVNTVPRIPQPSHPAVGREEETGVANEKEIYQIKRIIQNHGNLKI